ncbi:MAG: hypothetical protein A2538_01740 [Candidatus Magasanikbacteria bacterium RIFOXYD2_FULL_41_14]|uniref:Uncharacterized protein n=1 Tax=Candidatus Magasanikbacteria bacterium RIFOXYD2_FULL_41_14 TaxID=1798709 RepID=A0A1F6PDP1_9BACT|nr:MAG: hypothetical protein A2538_01740 [Candidatus Magasanikbacteria bacterium RIFOXYD2_FULL_41_14]
MKKIFLIISSLIIIIMVMLMINIKYDILLRYNISPCTILGGKTFMHSFGSNCEIGAWDANKSCTYDNECHKNLCSYGNTSGIQNSTNGHCAKYKSEEGTVCHRPKGKAVICDGFIT